MVPLTTANMPQCYSVCVETPGVGGWEGGGAGVMRSMLAETLAETMNAVVFGCYVRYDMMRFQNAAQLQSGGGLPREVPPQGAPEMTKG